MFGGQHRHRTVGAQRNAESLLLISRGLFQRLIVPGLPRVWGIVGLFSLY
jgi:hypothetical protein